VAAVVMAAEAVVEAAVAVVARLGHKILHTIIYLFSSMKLKYLLTVAAIVGATKMGFAQYYQDAIRLSTSQYGTTSRIKAIGGAGIAVGGDMSSISGNPAGLGFFTKSEFSFTPELDMSKSKSSYFGTSNSSKSNNGNLNSASAVFYSRLNTPQGADKTKGWLSLNFGISYNRTSNFYQHVNYGGTNNTSSIADYYAQLANNSNYIDNQHYVNLPNHSLESIAWSQYLIDSTHLAPGGAYAIYEPNTALNSPNPVQNSVTTTEGGQSEYAFSVGANYSNKLYLGFGLGIVNVRYNSYTDFTESGYEFVNFKTNYVSTYQRQQQTTGTGFNMRLGAIYKPVDAVRIGATINTPTWYSLDDNTYEGINTKYNGQGLMTDGQNYPLSYQFRTPWKVSGGLAVFAGKIGFISADIDYLDYTNTHLTSNDAYDNADDNSNIKNIYKSAVKARLGAEIRVNSTVFLRGGYGIQGNTFKTGGADIKSATGGLGFRFQSYYIDLAYVHQTTSDTIYPYVLDGNTTPAAALRNSADNVFATFGIRF
jgi:hypothetical protein